MVTIYNIKSLIFLISAYILLGTNSVIHSLIGHKSPVPTIVLGIIGIALSLILERISNKSKSRTIEVAIIFIVISIWIVYSIFSIFYYL